MSPTRTLARIAVIGDVMVDRYITGSVSRISPEAPVPVLLHGAERIVAGGAANVAANAAALGAAVALVGLVGHDQPAEQLRGVLSDHPSIDLSGLVIDPARPTVTKTRVMSGHQQIVRIDREDTSSLDAAGADAVLSAVRDAVEGHDHRCVIVLSDYAKGMLDEAVVQRVIAFARERSLPVVVDPKSADIRKYSGATVVKPNFAEAALMAGVSATAPTEEVLAQIAEAMAIVRLRLLAAGGESANR